jgi:hippurate hydrolase
VLNAAEQTEALAEAAAGLVGAAQVNLDHPSSMGSEDFSYMMREVPGAYINIGNGEGSHGGCELHNPAYDFNDHAIPYGAGVLAAVVEKRLVKAG